MSCCEEPTESTSLAKLPYRQLTKLEMAQNFLGAMKRLGQERAQAFGLALKGDFSKLPYRVAERTYIERLMCCSTCRATNKCPYCGCNLIGRRFSKSVLNSETGCPNPRTYPKLKKYPPRNYWQVCNEKTTIIIPARDEPYLNKTIESLLANATGRIEIIVVLDGYDFDVIKHRQVKVIHNKEPQDRRHSINEAAKQAKGQYLFHLDIDAGYTIGEGYDTKLKCACEDRAIAVSIICGTSLSKTIPMGCSSVCMKVSANIGCQILNHIKTARNRMGPSLFFISLAWMIKKNYFWELGGYDVSPSACGYDEPEWSLRVWLQERQPGKVFLLNENYKLPAEI